MPVGEEGDDLGDVVACVGGLSDPFRAADVDFVALLRSRHVAVTSHLWPGGHAASYWNSHMAEYLRFYASSLDTCGG
jgi:enterochelin esterase-like enzyme